jgi:hypothetical protein
LVLAVVVLLGMLLLAKAAPSSSTTIATRKSSGSTVPTVGAPQTTTTRPTTTTPTTIGNPHPAAQVKVLVLNGTGGKIKMAATINGGKIKAKGYSTLAPGDAVGRPTSAVFYAPGYQADAIAVGKVLNIPAASAVPVPTPPPAPNAGQANVIVLLGQDTPA